MPGGLHLLPGTPLKGMQQPATQAHKLALSLHLQQAVRVCSCADAVSRGGRRARLQAGNGSANGDGSSHVDLGVKVAEDC